MFLNLTHYVFQILWWMIIIDNFAEERSEWWRILEVSTPPITLGSSSATTHFFLQGIEPT